MSRLKIDEEMFVEIVKSSKSMAEACSKLNMHMNTFIKYAKLLGVYSPNQGQKGKKRNRIHGKTPLYEIIYENKHPQFQSNKLRQKLFNEGVKEKKCEKCNIVEWLGLPISFELEHIDGNSHNHYIDNLMILCPNCHCQTSTYRGKNSKNK